MDERRDRELLEAGGIEVLGQVMGSSNRTFLVETSRGDERCWAIYKPEAGERPLHDFEPGLYRRERAAYVLSEALDWGLVPLTIVREDAPFGVGSLQRFVEADLQQHYFTLYAEFPETHAVLRRLALFDVIANNTDRKAGHVLRGVDGRVWGIDHGLCFAAPFKLRTVIWDFGREPIEEQLLEDIAPLADEVPPELTELLSPPELRALRERARTVGLSGRYPSDPSRMRFPWPMI